MQMYTNQPSVCCNGKTPTENLILDLEARELHYVAPENTKRRATAVLDGE